MTRDRKFLFSALAFVSGVFFYPFVHPESWLSFAAGAACAVLAFLTEGKGRVVWIVVLGFVLGLARLGVAEGMGDIDSQLRRYEGEKISLVCRVAELPQVKNGKRQIVLAAEDAGFPRGRILAFSDAYGALAYGDRVRFEGKLSIPESFEDFDYRRYLFGRNIYFVSFYPRLELIEEERGGWQGALYAFRARAESNLNRLLPAPQGGILAAMILGAKSDEIVGAMEDFNRTGTSHIIVVSGSHLVIILAILLACLLGLGLNRRRIFLPAALGLIGFTALSGWGASAVRSLVMALIFLVASRIGRGRYAPGALVFSAAAMIFLNPLILWDDVGFQLSFLAAFGVICLYPALEKRFGATAGGGMWEIVLATLAAQLATLPVIAYNFGQFSLLSLLANLLILPTVPFLMTAGFLLAGVSFVNLPLARILAWPIYLIISYQLAVAHLLAGTDFGLINF